MREGSDGGNGSVHQVNASGASALALNLNDTDQSAEQDQSGPGHGTAIQALGQDAGNKQHADADATSEQICPVNLNAPVSVGSQDHKQKSKDVKAPKRSKGGSVMQANLSQAVSAAGDGHTSGARSTSSATLVPPAGSRQPAGSPSRPLGRGYLSSEQESAAGEGA